MNVQNDTYKYKIQTQWWYEIWLIVIVGKAPI